MIEEMGVEAWSTTRERNSRIQMEHQVIKDVKGSFQRVPEGNA